MLIGRAPVGLAGGHADADHRRLAKARLVGAGVGKLLEKLAMQAPVKMLFPMALCIFPCTFLVLGMPVAAQLLNL